MPNQDLGVEKLLENLIEKVPPPVGNIEDELKALIIDSWFDPYLGVVSLIRIVNGEIKVGEKIKVYSTNQTYKVEDVGIFFTKKKLRKKNSPQERLVI